MSDLVERLRNFNPKIIMNDAADEIEMLRNELREQRVMHSDLVKEMAEEIERLKKQIEDAITPW